MTTQVILINSFYIKYLTYLRVHHFVLLTLYKLVVVLNFRLVTLYHMTTV